MTAPTEHCQYYYGDLAIQTSADTRADGTFIHEVGETSVETE
jgi:hypothetical protein